mgnify:CR=1 FL=1
MSAGEAAQHVLGFLDFVMDVFLEVQSKTYSYILCLMNHVAHGFHLSYESWILKEMYWKTVSQHPGLATSMHWLWASFKVWYLNARGNVLKACLPTSCFRHKSAGSGFARDAGLRTSWKQVFAPNRLFMLSMSPYRAIYSNINKTKKMLLGLPKRYAIKVV